jgi:protein-tyrosine-phosphatase
MGHARRGTGLLPHHHMNVLFVCEDNCALSIMAESILRAVAPDRFGAYSAGCFNNGPVNGQALELLARHRLPVMGLHAKSLLGLRRSTDLRVDLIITLSDCAAEEDYSGWPGEPFVAHWALEEGDAADADEALRNRFWTLMRRIKVFTSLPHGRLSRRLLERRALRLEPSYL